MEPQVRYIRIDDIRYNPDTVISVDSLLSPSEQSYGKVQPIILDKSNMLVHGEEWLILAIQMGLEEVPVIYQSKTRFVFHETH